MKKIWKNHKLKIILAVYLLAIGIFVRFAAMPMAENIKNKSDKIQEKIIDDQITQSRIGQISRMEEDYGIYKSNTNALDVVLNTNGEVDFIKQLEAIAQESGNKIALSVQENQDIKNQKSTPATSTAPGPSSANTAKNKDTSIQGNLSHKDYISMKITLLGNYASLVKFLQKIENYRYYVNIISLDLGKTEEETGDDNNHNSSSQTSTFGVFSPSSSNQSTLLVPQEEPKPKDVLKSILNVVVYINK